MSRNPSTARSIILVLTLMLALGAIFYASRPPWKDYASRQAERYLAARGYEAEVVISAAGADFARFSRIALPAQGIEAHDVELRVTSALRLPAKGTWRIGRLTWRGMPEFIPHVAGEGTFDVSEHSAVIAGKIDAPDDALTARAKATLNLEDFQQSSLAVEQAALRQLGGVWRLAPVTLRLADARWKLRVLVERQPVEALMAAFGQPPVQATGTVRGAIPLTIDRKAGTVEFAQAGLQSVSAGTLALSPETLPAQDGQLAQVRDLLSDFHYRLLSIAVDGKANWQNPEQAQKKPLTITLHLEGNNPDVYNGRPVKLNINLRGDIASLMKYSLLPIADPRLWMKEAP